MSILRMGHDEWGRTLANGLSWDLLAFAFWAGVVVIVGHFILHALTSGRRRRGD